MSKTADDKPTLDYKNTNQTTLKNVATKYLSPADRKALAQACISKVDGKNVLHRGKAISYLYENHKDKFIWQNAPKPKGTKTTIADEFAKWLENE